MNHLRKKPNNAIKLQVLILWKTINQNFLPEYQRVNKPIKAYKLQTPIVKQFMENKFLNSFREAKISNKKQIWHNWWEIGALQESKKKNKFNELIITCLKKLNNCQENPKIKINQEFLIITTFRNTESISLKKISGKQRVPNKSKNKVKDQLTNPQFEDQSKEQNLQFYQ